MWERRQAISNQPAEWIGDGQSLLNQLGPPEGLLDFVSVSSTAKVEVTDAASLSRFLRDYHAQVLIPMELPAICSAQAHAARSQARELIALDCSLNTSGRMPQHLAAASRRVGKAQLQKLRPLRDQRLVQRYIKAVEIGQAHGWHTVVYGLALAIYSLPLRQGLLAYANQTTLGFIQSAARSLRLSERQCRRVFESVCASLPNAVESLSSWPENPVS